VVVEVAGLAGDLQDLGGVREPEAADRDRLAGPELDAAMAAVTGAVQLGDTVPGQTLAAVQQVGWLALTTTGSALACWPQELGGLGVGLERIGGDHYLGKVEPVQERGEGGDLLGGAADLTLGQHRAGGMLHRHDLGRSCLPFTIRHHVTNETESQNAAGGQPGQHVCGQRGARAG
jgi:hypothetical protein